MISYFDVLCNDAVILNLYTHAYYKEITNEKSVNFKECRTNLWLKREQDKEQKLMILALSVVD